MPTSVAILVHEAEQEHLAKRHLRPRRVAELALGLVAAWRLAGHGEEVRGVGVEEALQFGGVARVQDADAPTAVARDFEIVSHCVGAISAGAGRGRRAGRRRRD
jgi:hypothetical protein